MGDRFQPPRPDVEPLDSIGPVAAGEPRGATLVEGGSVYGTRWSPGGVAVLMIVATVCVLVLHWAGVL